MNNWRLNVFVAICLSVIVGGGHIMAAERHNVARVKTAKTISLQQATGATEMSAVQLPKH